MAGILNFCRAWEYGSVGFAFSTVLGREITNSSSVFLEARLWESLNIRSMSIMLRLNNANHYPLTESSLFEHNRTIGEFDTNLKTASEGDTVVENEVAYSYDRMAVGLLSNSAVRDQLRSTSDIYGMNHTFLAVVFMHQDAVCSNLCLCCSL